MKIYIKEPVVDKGLEGFLKDFFKLELGKQTFLDEEYKNLQYRVGRRSLDDLLFICNTYFENVTDLDILRALSNINEVFFINYCNVPNKPVIKRVSAYEASYYKKLSNSNNIVKEVKNCYFYLAYNYTTFGKSKYSAKKIEELLS